MDLYQLKRDLFYRGGKSTLIKTSCLICIFLLMIIALVGNITPNVALTDQIPNEFKNTEDYQILEFEKSVCAVKSGYDLALNETNQKDFTYTFSEGNEEGIYLSIKELDDNSQDINPSDLKEPNYRYVESENMNIANTPIKKISFTDTHGETTNTNWDDYTIFTFDKNGKHYQITYYDDDFLADVEIDKIIESFTKK